MKMDDNIKEVLIAEDEIQKKTKEVAQILSDEYRDKNPLVVGILKGALPFMADLIKEMDIFLEYDMMDVSSYGTAKASSGEVKIIKDLDSSVENRDVLIVEDIIDTGRTLKYLQDMLIRRNAKSVRFVTLLDKPSGRVTDLTVDWKCFNIPDEFVVGYGLDYRENYRNLPYVGILKEEVYY
ncbi:hypoxanthine phosphoribosyltransferase [Atopostipes suicloacalis DSM 15692]|uniref:Hypoxanthine phosphoribosyltransferase n=2 Tax=Atopostipes suicloacalis TaxID=180295 RepID=A0A1M4V6L5_9LACT|nr:hypoxanthine phosphoribosyltransferase [Atopostipes suicloacalis DSM 15692]